jgi:hypothetical protein
MECTVFNTFSAFDHLHIWLELGADATDLSPRGDAHFLRARCDLVSRMGGRAMGPAKMVAPVIRLPFVAAWPRAGVAERLLEDSSSGRRNCPAGRSALGAMDETRCLSDARFCAKISCYKEKPPCNAALGRGPAKSANENGGSFGRQWC